MQPALHLDNISKSFGKYDVIDNLTLSIDAGTVYGLVGMNGAGKTTLLRLLLGLLRPDRGSIMIGTHSPWAHTIPFYQSCGVVLEHDGFWGNLTARENCEIYAAAKGLSSTSLETYLTTYWNDSELFSGTKKVKHFSRGQKMQCALCRAFLGNPEYFFLDEPVIALDLNGYNHFKELVHKARTRNATLIISSHQLDTIDELCDRVGIIQDGKITEITSSIDEKSEKWFIDTDESDFTGETLTSFGARETIFDKGYHFLMHECKRTIPEIIHTLSGAGISLREIKREDNVFSSIIQMYYGTHKRSTP